MTLVLGQFIEATGIGVNPLSAFEQFPTNVNNAVVDAFSNVIFPEYNGDPNDPDDRANKYEWQRFIEKTDCCIGLLEFAIAYQTMMTNGILSVIKTRLIISNDNRQLLLET